MTRRRDRGRVVVIGGGYAGVMAARAAVARSARTTLLDATGTHGFLPRLATIAAGVGPVSDAEAPLSDLVDGARIVVGRATAVDVQRQEVTVEGQDPLPYDALVVALGAASSLPGIPGLAHHALPLRDPDDALAIRAALATATALVVVGAGATGVQLAAEVSCAHPTLPVTLVERATSILPGLPEAMARRAAEVFTSRGGRILTGAGLAEVTTAGAVLDDGRLLAGLVVWAGGLVSSGNVLLPDAEVDDGQLVVDRAAQVRGCGSVFAAGDVAAHRGRDGALLPPTAQVAVRAGKLAGTNAARVAQGIRPRPGTLRHLGWVLPLGDGQAVAQVGPVVLADTATSRLAPLLHDVIDVRHLLTVGGLPAAVRHHQRL